MNLLDMIMLCLQIWYGGYAGLGWGELNWREGGRASSLGQTLCQLTVWPLSNQKETGCGLTSLNANLQGLDIHGLFSKETVSIKIDFFLSQTHSGWAGNGVHNNH